MPKTEPDPISDRLDVIIRLLLERFKKGNNQTVGDQIVFLESTGLEGKDVAKIMGIGINQITSYRRSAKKKGKQPAEGQTPERQDQVGVQA